MNGINKRALVVWLVLFALAVCSTCFADATAEYNCGLELQRDGKYREAIVEFVKVPADSDLAAKACYETARCFRELMNLDDAVVFCKRGLAAATSAEDRHALDKLLREVRLAPVGSLMKSQEWDQAIASLESLLSDYPEDARWLIAKCQMGKADYQVGLDTLAGLLHDFPLSPMAPTYRAFQAQCVYHLQGWEAAAGHLAMQVVSLGCVDPIVVESADIIAQVMVKAGRAEQAKAFYGTLVQSMPGHPLLVAWKVRLADLLHRQRDWRAAQRAYDMVCRDYPEGAWHISAEYMAADSTQRMGDYEDAIRRFETLSRVHAGVNEAGDAPRRLAKLSKLADGGAGR